MKIVATEASCGEPHHSRLLFLSLNILCYTSRMDSTLIAILCGLGGAVGWGASNFFAAKSSREKNVVVTVFNSQLFLFLAMSIIVLIIRPEIHVSWKLIAFIAINYLIFTLGLLISYKAYAVGPVSITSPIVGANSLIVVAVSVLAFGELLRINQWLGIVILFFGLAAASYDKKKGDKKENFRSSGIYLAFIALIFIGAGIAGFVYAIEQVGWVAAVLLGYFFPAFWTGLYLIFKKQFKRPYCSKSIAGLTVFQLLGTISVSMGIERSLAAIVVPVSSSISPLVTSIMGLLIFKEQIHKNKLLAVGLIIIGLVLISM